MKKTYIQPSIKTYKIHSASILEGSNIENGGSNSVSGAPHSADSKSNSFLGWDDDEE